MSKIVDFMVSHTAGVWASGLNGGVALSLLIDGHWTGLINLAVAVVCYPRNRG